MARPLGPAIAVSASNELLAELERAMAQSPRDTRKKALRVLRRALRSGKTAMSREIREKINLKKKQVDAAITTGVDSKTNLTGHVRGRNYFIPLIDFMTPRQVISAIRAGRTRRSEGVAVKVYKDQGKRVYKGTFVAVMPRTGHVSVFKRVYKNARLPIKKQYGPGLTKEFEKNLEPFAARASEQLQKEMLRILRDNVDIL